MTISSTVVIRSRFQPVAIMALPLKRLRAQNFGDQDVWMREATG